MGMRRLLAVVALAGVSCSDQPAPDSEWAELQPMDVARSEHPAVIYDDRLVVIGGLIETAPGRLGVTSSVEGYDVGSDSWTVLADLPAPRHHVMAAVTDRRLFVMGGFSESGFDPVSTMWELTGGDWVQRAPLPVPVGAGAAVTLAGDIYLVGGAPGGGLYRYSPDPDDWVELAAPTRDREHLAAVVLDGEIWAIAGRWQGEIFSSTEVYDPGTDTWREGPTLLEPRSGFGATVSGETIVVAGGEVFGPDEALSSVEYLVDGVWVDGEALPIGLHGNPLVVLGERMYLPGGSTRPGGVENPGSLLSLIAP